MPDGRRIGQAQRRRIGEPSNMYSNTMKPPTFGVGDAVRTKRTATGTNRYGPLTVVDILPNAYRPDGENDGHGYVVQGGKKGRTTKHLPSQLERME